MHEPNESDHKKQLFMKFIGIIPARYQSTRFPGKPLAKLGEKTIVQHVFDNAKKSIDEVWIATDDQRIANEVENFDGQYVMTGPHHQSGTDRCAEAAEIISKNTDSDVIVNIQGDEPFVRNEQIEALKSCFADNETQIATLIKKIENQETLFNPNRPKVVVDRKMNALLFSRSTIPFFRGTEREDWLNNATFYSHLGMYAYKTEVLKEITKLSQTPLELSESLEQLRWLENGYKIKTAITEFESIGIDTPEDLEYAKSFL